MEVEKLVPPKQSAESKCSLTRSELSRVNWIALPMIVVTVSQFLLRVSPMFMLGHLDQLSLSSASIATSLCNVTGFSVIFGMSSALETLCGQAYGANQYKRVGTFTCAAIICLILVCVPLSLLFMLTQKLLVMTGQDPVISAAAGQFAIQLIPTLFPFAFLQCLVRYLQSQSLIFPMVWSSLASLCVQLPLCWAFIFKLNLGNTGAAISIGISSWFNVALLLLYVMHSPACRETRAPFSSDVFASMREFLQLAIPSAAMVCLEWWSYELILLLSGVLPNPQLETSVFSIWYMISPYSTSRTSPNSLLPLLFSFTISYLHYHIPYSFGAAASTLISNKIGEGRPEAAVGTLYAVLAMSISEFLVASFAIVSCSRLLGYAFSEDKEVVHYVKQMAPFLAMSIILDGLQAVLSGVVRGIGLQHAGAYINLAAYYLVCIPVALFFAFVMHLKGQGLWSGLIAGGMVQSIALSLLTFNTRWDEKAIDARNRIFPVGFQVPNESVCKHEKLVEVL